MIYSIKELNQLRDIYKNNFPSGKISDFAKWLCSKNINLLLTKTN